MLILLAADQDKMYS